MTPLLSIVIPTKNRYSTLFSVVDTILSFDDNDIEIVIQDNSDSNEEALHFISERSSFNNLKYFYVSGKLSVIENSDKAVLNSTGEYVCFIGDDDCVLPIITKVTKWIKANDFKSLKSYKPSYSWPNQKANYFSKDMSGILKVEKFNSDYKIISTKKALEKTIKKGGTSIKQLPCLYHGIVEREILNKIYDKCNSFFPGPSPDMSNAIALTQIINQYVYLNYPIVISGKSDKSTGGAGILHKHVSRIEDVTHLPSDTALLWSEKNPKYWTGQTIWAESVLKVLDKYDNKKALKSFNYNYLYASIDVFNWRQKKIIYQNFKFHEININYLFSYLKITIMRINYFIKTRFSSQIKRFNRVKNIEQAIRIIEKNYNNYENNILNEKQYNK